MKTLTAIGIAITLASCSVTTKSGTAVTFTATPEQLQALVAAGQIADQIIKDTKSNKTSVVAPKAKVIPTK